MIPVLDLQASYRSIATELEAAALAVLRSGRYVLGAEVAAFEAEFAAYCGAGHAVGLDSGTSALHLALRAAGVGPGDEVITVPMTFVATVAAILYAGARPVLVDVDEDRPGAGVVDRGRGRDEREGHGDHLVAGADAGGQQREVQGAGAGVDADALGRAAVRGELLLERGHLAAERELAALEHAEDGRVDLLLDRVVLSPEVDEGNHASCLVM
jgi:hypothetical protein